MLATYAQTRDAELLRTIDRVVEVIAQAQRADGYLHTPVLNAARRSPGFCRDADARPLEIQSTSRCTTWVI